jgi:MFS family permease
MMNRCGAPHLYAPLVNKESASGESIPPIPPLEAPISPGSRKIKRARIATIFLFFANGIALSALTPRLADLQGQLSMSDITLGLVLSAGAAGGLFFGPFAAIGIKRLGSGPFAMYSLLVMLPLLPLVGIAPTAATLAVVMFAIGAVDSVLDASQNAHGLEVQRIYKRSIINNMHAFWALGTVAGALVGALTLALNVSLGWTLLGVSIAGIIGTLITFSWVLPRNPENDSPVSDSSSESSSGSSFEAQIAEEIAADHLTAMDPSSIAPERRFSTWKLSGPTMLPLLALGVLILLAVVVEDVPQRWSSIYLTDIGMAANNVGFGVVAFTISLTIGRFLGDSFVNRFGERRVAQVSMSVVAVVLAASLFIGNGIGFIAACAVVGFGVATLFPAAMHAATYIPGISPGNAITAVSWMSRAGFVFAPILVGIISENLGVQWGIGIAVFAALLIIPFARFLRNN